jgi:hypothetical protein
VHRWAASFVRQARTDPRDPPEESFFVRPADADLIDWFTDGHAALTDGDPAVWELWRQRMRIT